MALLRPDNVLDVAIDLDPALDETSDEPFDRAEFALEAIELLRPWRTTVAVGTGYRLRVEAGRAWGRGDERWALLIVSPNASRKAILTAVASLARAPGPYALAVLEARAGGFGAE